MNQSSQPFQLPNPISLPMVQGVLTIGEAFALALVSFPPVAAAVTLDFFSSSRGGME